MLCHILLDTCIVKAIRNVVLARTVECHPAIAGYKECGRIRSTRNNPRAYKEGKRIGGGGGGAFFVAERG